MKMDGGLGDHTGEAITFLGPGVMIMVAEDNSAAFGTDKEAMLVLVDDEHIHTGNGHTMFFSKPMIFDTSLMGKNTS